MPSRTFHVIAHRGDSAHAPENTLRAFEAALKAGADAIEIDVRVTKDGVAVLIHDASVFRTTLKEANVADLTLEDIRALDAGSFKGEKFKNAKIPTLDEALGKFLAKVPFNVELKAFGAVLPTILALQKYADQGAFERALLTSFKRELLVSALMLDSRCKVCQLLEHPNTATVSEVKHLGAAAISPHCEDLTKDMLDEAHKLNLAVLAWGAKNLDAAKAVIDLGADGATYDDPGELLAYLKERGMREHELPLPMLSGMYPLKPASSSPHPPGNNGKNGNSEPAKAALPEKAAASSKSSGRQG